MTDGAPEGWHTVTPRLFVEDTRRFVEFLKRAFDGQGEYQDDRPSEIWIGDSVVMVGAVGPRAATQSAFYLYVPDADATHARALAAGATSIEEPTDTPYGDRRAMVRDEAGNTWQVATRTASS
jgi:uncharacterized glyoxalase superfamily protein PhnB